jgi:hypothetical protein
LACSRKGRQCVEIVQLGTDLQVGHVRRLEVAGVGQVQDFFLTSNFNILMCRGSQRFCVNQVTDYFQKHRRPQHKREEE